MRRLHTPVAAVAAALLIFAAGTATTAETLESVIKKADAKLYYPQNEGLSALQADVQSSMLDEYVQNNPDLKNIRLNFYWSLPYKSRFAATGVPQEASYQAREFEQQLDMWGQWFVPKPLALTLADYKAKLSENEQSYVIDGSTTAPAAQIWAMKYAINKETFLPTRWSISTDQFDADVDIKYERLASGQYLPVQLKAQADGTVVTIKLAYKKVDKWTVGESVNISFESGEGPQQMTLRLLNHKLNQPIPAGTFPKP